MASERVEPGEGLAETLGDRTMLTDVIFGKWSRSASDSRNDLGTGGPSDNDGVAGDNADYCAALLTVSATGALPTPLGPNVKVSDRASNAVAAGSMADYGERTAIAFAD